MTFDSRASQTPGLFKLGEEHVALHSQLATLTNPASLFALRNRASSVIGNVLPLRHRRNYGLAVGGYLFGSLALFCGRHGRDLGGIINAPCRRESTDHSATFAHGNDFAGFRRRARCHYCLGKWLCRKPYVEYFWSMYRHWKRE